MGTLPDFGNFCISHPWGETQSNCQDMYDRYQGVKEMLPFAKGVSAKTYDFDANGEQPKMDYKRLLDIVKAVTLNGARIPPPPFNQLLDSRPSLLAGEIRIPQIAR